MRFKVITVGWNCADVALQTLESLAAQTVTDWDLQVIVDGPDEDGGATMDVVRKWIEITDWTAQMRVNATPQYVVRNQVEGIRMLNPADDDVIVWLDLDGDRLAHGQVFERLAQVYEDPNVLLTYGSYVPDPWDGWAPAVAPFSEDVVRRNAYRETISQGTCFINHLRTMRGIVFRNIPESYFKFPDGTWHESGTDYTFMVSGLELAGGRYRCISETLLLYNSAQPHPENMRRPEVTHRCVIDTTLKPPLERLP